MSDKDTSLPGQEIANKILLDAMRNLTDDEKIKNDPAFKASLMQSILNANMTQKIVEKATMPLLDRIKSWFKAAVGFKSPPSYYPFWDFLAATGVMNKDMANNMKTLTNEHPVFGGALATVTPFILILTQIFAYLGASKNVAAQPIHAALRDNLPSYSSAMQAAFIDPSTITRVRDILARSGYQEQDIDIMFKGMYNTYDEQTIRDLYLRGEIDLNKVYIRMREKGYTDTRTEEMTRVWDLIPPVQDIIMMAVREAFSDEQVASLGLDEAFPPKVAEWGKKQGLSEYWTRQYWRAHWQLPSPQMGFEMLHRGVIKEPELRGLIKALDYSPVWHDKLIAISYNVMTRVDARRLYELGILDDAGILKKYQEMGYSPADSELLVKWTKIEYNQEYRDLTKSEVIKQFLEGIIEETDAVDLLKKLGYTRDRITTMMALASYQRGYAAQGKRIEALHKLYITGQINDLEVAAELENYHIDGRRIEELIDLWALEYKAGLKLPIRRELDDWLKKGVISDRDYTTEMLRNGYSQMHIDMFIKAAHYAAPNA